MASQKLGVTALEDMNADADVGRIERPTLHNAVVNRIRDMIIEGQLPPGMRIHEGQLGEQLGVSRTPLREALKVLAMEGLVDLVPSRGALVHQWSSKDVHDMLTVLSTLEDLAGKLACANATEADIAEIRELHEQMMKCYREKDRLAYFKLNQQIHSAIISLSGNESLVLLHGMLQTRMKRVRFLGHQNADSWSAAVADHEEMVHALEAKDADALSTALVNHLARTWERIRDAI